VLAGEAAKLCAELGHEVRAALAGTPGAALALAASGASRLESVPLAQARLPRAGHLEQLANMGLKTLGALITLPDVELGRRFGPELVDHLARLTGRMPDPRHFIEPVDRFDQSLHLLEPVKDKETLKRQAGNAPMERLLAELELWLVSRQLGAEQLIWSFSTHREEDQVVLPVSFARAQQQKTAFEKIIRLKIDQVELPEDILNVRLEATRLIPWLGGSRQLFKLLPGEGEMSDSDASGLIDQLHARLGQGACSRIDTVDQHAPESAWQSARPGRRSRGSSPTSALPHAHPTARPLWLFDPPHPTKPDHLTLLKGPERIQTAWWREALWRDYYVASLDSGARCWAFVDASNQWYLHGYFG
jgi:protein ImuB